MNSHPPHFSPNAMRADFNLSRPKEANSCGKEQHQLRCEEATLVVFFLIKDTRALNVLPPKKKRPRGPDELQHVSKHCSSLSTVIKTQIKTVRRNVRPRLQPPSHVKRTHRPAREGPVVPFLFKFYQHFPIQLVLVQQRFDPVCVVLQVLQQHL